MNCKIFHLFSLEFPFFPMGKNARTAFGSAGFVLPCFPIRQNIGKSPESG